MKKLVLTQPGRLRMYSTSELIKLPAPTWLIDGIMPEKGVIGLYGPPGSGKSFVAVDMACSVGSGFDWQGKTAIQGTVIYISAEGGAGIGKRAAAWCATNDVPDGAVDVAWIIEAVPISADSDDMKYLFDRVEEIDSSPALVIIDTLARCFDGDENQQEDMGAFIKGVDLIRKELDTAVLIVHHTRLDGERERGNTAFRGAADTMISVKGGKAPQYKITVACDKQKDDEAFSALRLRLEKNEEHNSLVVRGVSIPPKLQLFIQDLKDAGNSTGTTYTLDELKQGFPGGESTFYAKLKTARDEGLIEKRGNRYVLRV